jgi:hypothetical protein
MCAKEDKIQEGKCKARTDNILLYWGQWMKSRWRILTQSFRGWTVTLPTTEHFTILRSSRLAILFCRFSDENHSKALKFLLLLV